MDDRCVICGRAGCDWHHPTGRDHEDRYIDGDLTLPQCHDDHELVHDDWHTLEIYHVGQRLTWFDRPLLALRRAGSYCARVAEANRNHPFYRWAAKACERRAAEIQRGIEALDGHSPGWRSDDRFYPSERDRRPQSKRAAKARAAAARAARVDTTHGPK